MARTVLVASLLLAPGIGFAEDPPISIEADKMSSTEKTNSVLFEGDVDARQGDTRIRSDQMTVFYTQQDAKKKNDEKVTQQVEKLVCEGNVEITRGEWLGTSKKSIYLSDKRQFILMGDAKAWQGQNMVSGEKIIYYLDEERSEVIGGRTKTTIGDSGEEKKSGRVNMTILQN